MRLRDQQIEMRNYLHALLVQFEKEKITAYYTMDPVFHTCTLLARLPDGSETRYTWGYERYLLTSRTFEPPRELEDWQAEVVAKARAMR